MTDSVFMASGSYRHVWQVQEYDGTHRVVKTLKYELDFDTVNFERHLRDAVALEQLSSSPYIVDIHGYCCNSAYVNYTADGDLTLLWRNGKNYTKRELLTIAHNVASSVADAHYYDSNSRATIAHSDIKPNQFLNFGGRYMLNDFIIVHTFWNGIPNTIRPVDLQKQKIGEL